MTYKHALQYCEESLGYVAGLPNKREFVAYEPRLELKLLGGAWRIFESGVQLPYATPLRADSGDAIHAARKRIDEILAAREKETESFCARWFLSEPRHDTCHDRPVRVVRVFDGERWVDASPVIFLAVTPEWMRGGSSDWVVRWATGEGLDTHYQFEFFNSAKDAGHRIAQILEERKEAEEEEFKIKADEQLAARARIDEILFDRQSAERGIDMLQSRIHRQNKEAGWWDEPREFGTCLALIHSELSEALEADRQDLMDSHLPHRKGTEVELADAVIRILDLAEWNGLDIAGAILEKLEYNRKREDHKKENRAQKNGKKY